MKTTSPDKKNSARGNLLLLCSVGLAVACMTTTQALAGNLEEDFRHPPDSAKPFVWWHWMGPYFSKDGITKDLEALKASGIGGATIFNLSSALLKGPLQEPNPLYPRPCGGAGAEGMKKQMPINPLYPRPCGGAGAEGMKKQMPINNRRPR